MSEELKPCPFCGGTDIAISVDENQGNKWGSAVCYSCSAVGPEVRTGYETYPEASWRAEAAAEWNRRASPTPPTTEGRENGHLLWRLRHNDTAKHLCGLAADEIERLSALLSSPRVEDVRRMREALKEMVYETTHLSSSEEDGSHICKISAQTLSQARAALSLPDGEGDKQATRASGPTAPTDRL